MKSKGCGKIDQPTADDTKHSPAPSQLRLTPRRKPGEWPTGVIDQLVFRG